MSRFFLSRPVFAWVIAIAMMLAGALAIVKLPISQYPPIAPPSISISAVYPGASAKTVEDSVVQIIEQKMTGLDRMLYMDSTSDSSGSAAITLTFAPGTDPDIAWAKVQNKLQLAMPALPDVVQQTGVTVSKSTRNYLLIAGVVSEDGSMDNADLNDYTVSKIESVIGRVPGVGEVQVFGTAYSMRVWLDPDKLTKYGITSDDVVLALRAYNVEVSAGQLGGAPAVPGQRLNASILVQSLILILLALPFGLSIHPIGVVIVLLLIALIGLLTASIAYAVALAVRNENSYAPIIFTSSLPILLLSGVLLPLGLAPQWLRNIAAANPLSYAVDAARAVFNDHLTDPSVIKGVAIMLVLSIVAIVVGARAFGRAVA